MLERSVPLGAPRRERPMPQLDRPRSLPPSMGLLETFWATRCELERGRRRPACNAWAISCSSASASILAMASCTLTSFISASSLACLSLSTAMRPCAVAFPTAVARSAPPACSFCGAPERLELSARASARAQATPRVLIAVSHRATALVSCGQLAEDSPRAAARNFSSAEVLPEGLTTAFARGCSVGAIGSSSVIGSPLSSTPAMKRTHAASASATSGGGASAGRACSISEMSAPNSPRAPRLSSLRQRRWSRRQVWIFARSFALRTYFVKSGGSMPRSLPANCIAPKAECARPPSASVDLHLADPSCASRSKVSATFALEKRRMSVAWYSLRFTPGTAGTVGATDAMYRVMKLRIRGSPMASWTSLYPDK
mmetsp:Transcript_39430/g.122960  ORF Transcript_39430/g.122960 Transcript_39430/m.122960 type:complete len:371 (-) Transcript_39430:1015-2127(-)